jgi:hypothetical protein
LKVSEPPLAPEVFLAGNDNHRENEMSKYLTVVPAYGRDYKSQKEVKEAWAAGHDFLIADASSPDNGRYVNKDDAVKGITFNIRYKGNTEVCVIKAK